MADVEFEPLHGENEEEEAEFILGGKKKDASAKKHKQKRGELFPRKSVEKKDRTVVIDNTKAFGTTPSSAKSSHFPHHHSRTVEGLVGPGDIQYGSSPPNYDEEGVIQNALFQSSGSSSSNSSNIPVSVSQNQPSRPLQLSVRPVQPPAWAQVSHATPNQLQQKTLSQEKLTLLEQANIVVNATKSHQDGTKTPDRADERRNFPVQSYPTPVGLKTPPRVASPTDNNSFSPPSHISSSTAVGRRFERSESWGPSTHTESATKEENWADFSKSFDGSLSADEGEFESNRRRQSQVSTISEGSEGSYVSEIDDSVWRITEEQRSYYVTQFKKLQPNEKGLIKGPQARDFFMKSNLPVEVLSKIWHLSDINKDNALDLEEFCIAMHLVVAVKHEVDLPSTLPALLQPKQEDVPQFEASFPSASNDATHKSSNQNGYTEEERPQSPQQQPQDDQWARFEASEHFAKKDASSKEEQSLQAQKQSHSAHPDTELKRQSRSSDDSLGDARKDGESFGDEAKVVTSPSKEANPIKVPVTPASHESRSLAQEANTPVVSKESLTKKSSIGIARPRGLGPSINLMDAAPGQLLPPPDIRKNRKMAQQAQPEPAGRLSPPNSPESRFSTNFPLLGEDYSSGPNDKPMPNETEQHDEAKKQSEVSVDRIRKPEAEEVKKREATQDGFEPPKITPRKNQPIAKELAGREPPKTAQFRRSSSIRRGERPRSYTADSKSSMESLVDNIPRPETKDLTIPPTPPPRKTKSHKRGSSLDLNKIFSKSHQNLAEARGRIEREIDISDALPPRIPRADTKDEKKDKKEKGDVQAIARPRPAAKSHQRSVSHDASKPLAPLAPPPKTSEGFIKDTPTPGHRKKPAPPKPSAALRNGRSKSLERTIDSTKIEESSTPLEKRPRNLSRPLRQKRQKHEIQAEIRLLREKNASISSLNSELHHELREAMENRTVLETKLAKTKQSFE
ncbi:ralBP1-associated Eps domain-containing protein 2-like [Rhopilema esculentum]|uniref:ralBP1-associated Eps domain-containing protein 2-like n=1 Tax=Rhopilema esculentum TaxID=499914 RepID=UPI0031D10F71